MADTLQVVEDNKINYDVSAKKIEDEKDTQDEKNLVKPLSEKELEVVNGKAGTLSASLLRRRERDQLLKADELIRQQQYVEREKNRQLELMKQVNKQFNVVGEQFHFKDRSSELAFKVKGNSLISASNDDRVAHGIVMMASAKGWKTIKISGHRDFQREVWMEANLRGIETRGYRPTELDLQQLEVKRENTMLNSVEHDPTPLKRTQSNERKIISEPKERTGATETVALRAYAGKVLEHGTANFNHDPKEKPNYFVKLETDKGEKTIWGVDLKRAIQEGKVKPGDDVNLEYRGNTAVTIETLKRDKDGNVIGTEEITTNRNQWDIAKSDKAKVVEAVAFKYIDSIIKDPKVKETLKMAVSVELAERDKANKVPAVEIYDKAGKSQQQEPTRQVNRNPERER